MTTAARRARSFAVCAFAALLVCLGAFGTATEVAGDKGKSAHPRPIQILGDHDSNALGVVMILGEGPSHA